MVLQLAFWWLPLTLLRRTRILTNLIIHWLSEDSETRLKVDSLLLIREEAVRQRSKLLSLKETIARITGEMMVEIIMILPIQ